MRVMTHCVWHLLSRKQVGRKMEKGVGAQLKMKVAGNSKAREFCVTFRAGALLRG